MFEHKKAVIFDMDGTLMDSMWMWKDIDIEYLGRFHIELPRDLEIAIEGMGFTETAAYFKNRFQLPLSVEEVKADWNRMAYEKYEKQVPLKQGALQMLLKLKEMGLRLGIATSNHIELARAALKSNQVEGLFDCIRTSCEVAKGKPAPDVYLSVADAFRVTPKECLVFEDVPMGIQAGLNAGMQVCAVEDDYSRNRTQEIRSLANYYIHNFDEVLDHTYEVLR
ncbi:MAG: HAD family phosphatase [Lachnospiraceae bacterium]|nr:HAD family phosphatase [Lachnospiraceae bacterium]